MKVQNKKYSNYKNEINFFFYKELNRKWIILQRKHY